MRVDVDIQVTLDLTLGSQPAANVTLKPVLSHLLEGAGSALHQVALHIEGDRRGARLLHAELGEGAVAVAVPAELPAQRLAGLVEQYEPGIPSAGVQRVPQGSARHDCLEEVLLGLAGGQLQAPNCGVGEMDLGHDGEGSSSSSW